MSQLRGQVLASVMVAAVAIGLYLPNLTKEFVFDDVAQIVVDDYTHDLSNLPDVLTFRVLGKDVLDHNRPVNLLSLMIDSAVWGKHRPAGYHLTNILLHAACVVMVFWLLNHLLVLWAARANRSDARRWATAAAAMGALLTAVHPVNSEAVCCPAFREDLLAGLFVLAGLLLAARFSPRLSIRNVLLAAGVAAAMLAATASKEVGVVAPVLLGVYWLLLRRHERRAGWIALIAATFAVVAAFLAARFALQPAQSDIFIKAPKYIGGSLTKTLAIQPRIWVFYLRLIVWPDMLCAWQGPHTVGRPVLAVELSVLAIVIAITLLIARKSRLVLLAAAFYWLALAPVSNLIPIYRPVSDRYLYLPMVGVAMMLAAVVSLAKVPTRRVVRISCAVVYLAVCAALAVVTVQRQRVWNNSLSLWQDTYGKNPRETAVVENLAEAIYETGRNDPKAIRKAIGLWNVSQRIARGKDAGVWGSLAVAYDALGDTRTADAAYLRACKLDGRYRDLPRLRKGLTLQDKDIRALEVIAARNPPPAAKQD